MPKADAGPLEKSMDVSEVNVGAERRREGYSSMGSRLFWGVRCMESEELAEKVAGGGVG